MANHQPGGRECRLKLSPMDHIARRGSTQVHLCFPFDGDQDDEVRALGRVFAAYEVAVQRWPFLAGQVVPFRSTEQDVLEVEYLRDPTEREVSKSFGESVLGPEKMWTHQQLEKWGAPPGWLTNRLLEPKNPVQKQLRAGKERPVTIFQHTFVDGGLVLSFQFDRSVMDGVSIKLFLQVFALACRPGKKGWRPVTVNPIQDRLAELDFLLPRAAALPEGYDALSHCDEYNLATPDPDAPRSLSWVIFEFKHSRIQLLKEQVSYLLEQIDCSTWVSTTDCICGLIWVAVMRARAHRLDARAEVKFTTAVDARGRVTQPVTDYMGNLTVAAMAKYTLEDLIGKRRHGLLNGRGTFQDRQWLVRSHEVLGVRNDIDLLSIAKAAVRIRRAIMAVDEDYVKHRMAIGPDDAAKMRTVRAYANAIDIGNTGVHFSSCSDWLQSEGFDPHGQLCLEYLPAELDGKMRFDLPGVPTDYPDFVRISSPQHEGSCTLLPRRTGGEAGEHATWELSLCLAEDEMKRLRFVTELGGWVRKTFCQTVDALGIRQRYRHKVAAEKGKEKESDRQRAREEDDEEPLANKRQKVSESAMELSEINDVTTE